MIDLREYAARVAELRSLQKRHEYSGNQSLVHELRWLERDIDRITAEILAVAADRGTPPVEVPPDVNLGDSAEFGTEYP